MNINRNTEHGSAPTAFVSIESQRTGRLAWFSKCLLSALALSLLAGCEFFATGGRDNGDKPPDPVNEEKLYILAPDGSREVIETQGEQFTATVGLVNKNHVPGSTLHVVMNTLPGVSFLENSFDWVMPAIGAKVTKEVHVTVEPSAASGKKEINARIGADEGEGLGLNVVDKLVNVVITPENQDIPVGESRTYQLAITPRGLTKGSVELKSSTPATGVTVTPSTFTATVEQGSHTPVLQTIKVDAGGQITVRGNSHLDISRGNVGIASATYKVIDAEGNFAIGATPTQVSAPNGYSTGPVVFTVQSQNGFTGTVHVHWTADGYMLPNPDTNDFAVAVTPQKPGKFTRTIVRHLTDNNKHDMTFTATDDPLTTTRSVAITVDGH